MSLRRGFILHTVLWCVAIGSTVALSSEVGGREGIDASRNRVNSELAAGAAQGCAAVALAELDAAYRGLARQRRELEAWIGLDQASPIASPWIPAGCEISLRPLGTRVNVNSATDRELYRLLTTLDGRRTPGAIIAELRQGRRLGTFTARDEIARVPIVMHDSALLALLDVESHPVSLWHAPRAVLATLPGFNERVIQAVIAIRARGTPILDLREVAVGLGSEDAAFFAEHFEESSRLIVLQPSGWELTGRASAGSPPIVRHESWRIGRNDQRLVVRERRAW